MAISIDWSNKIINIPRNDLTLIQSSPSEIRELDMNSFRLILKDLEDDEEGMPFPDTHSHVAPINVGGVTLARVIEIKNGYSATFENGQYAVNLKGANTNLQDVTNVNQVSIRPSNSAGLQDLSTILASSYSNTVVVDVLNGQAGTDVPIGTRGSPVNNFADALVIAENNGINQFTLPRSATISSGDFSKGFTFKGDNLSAVSVGLQSGANLKRCEFNNLTISGVLDGNAVIRQCNVYDITYFDGMLWQSALNGTITIMNGKKASIAECFSNVAGGGADQYTNIDMGASGSLVLREFNGGLSLSNYHGGGSISMDYNAGRLVLDDSITSGDIYIRGSCSVHDYTTGAANIYDQTLHKDLEVINDGIKKSSIFIPHTNDLT